MILDARIHLIAIHYKVWHAELCRVLTNVVWVDDFTNTYGVVSGSPYAPTTVEQAKKIVIIPEMLLVIINPIDDAEVESLFEGITDHETTPTH